jgi:Zn-dependent protease with chaperone function
MPLKLVLAVAGLASALGAAAADPRDVPLQVHATLVRLLQVARLPARTPVRLVAVDGPGRAAISDAGTVLLSRQLWSGEHPLDRDEMAAVLAHELAHLEEAGTKPGACEAVVAPRDDELAPAAPAAANCRTVPSADQQLAIAVMRRNHLRELRADRRGAEMLAGIGVPPQAMTRMLLKLTAPGNGDYSGSHPAIEARLENLGFVAGQRPRRE